MPASRRAAIACSTQPQQAARLKAKSQLNRGEWLPFLKVHCRCSPRQAQRYMQIAEEIGEDAANATRASHASMRSFFKALAEGEDEDEEVATEAAIPNQNKARLRTPAVRVASDDERSPEVATPAAQVSSTATPAHRAVSASSPAVAAKLSKMLTFAPGTPEAKALDELESVVRCAAQKSAKKLYTKPMRLAHTNEEAVAQALLMELAKRISSDNPEVSA
jgi:hypothetical protein